MAFLSHISFSQVFLVTTMLVLAGNGEARAIIGSPFCAETNHGVEKDLCNSLVNGARTWNEALSRVILAAIEQVKPVKPLIDGLGPKLPPSLRPISRDSIVQTCSESYGNILDEFNGALENIRTGDKTGAINSQLSAALSSLSDCTDGLEEFGIDGGDLKRFQGILEKYASLSLAVSSTKTKKT
ncbi:uncharacterized protein [Coffea arabica]|uniref:Pectinesterase inhibitor domain-containing protein n=1 Tax=Coffea arabica TaxID=13443 RepID=A0A6P6V9Q3_COFAR|nr:uncharacterized protein LOC113718641 [Coffea arabica]